MAKNTGKGSRYSSANTSDEYCYIQHGSLYGGQQSAIPHKHPKPRPAGSQIRPPKSTPPPLKEYESVAEVEQLSPFGWRVYISTGLLRYGGNDGWGWVRLTEAGARRCATRQLKKYRLKQDKKKKSFTIR